MKAKHTRDEIKHFGAVHNCTEGIDDASGYKPADHPDWQSRKNLSGAQDAQPAHHDIDPCIEPAWRADVKNLNQHTDQGQ
jgi:hypothetical protein